MKFEKINIISLKIKENKYKVPLILLGLFLTSSWFYWFQWRPSEIRKECTNSVETQFYEAWLYGQQNYASIGNKAFEKQSQLDYLGRTELRNRCLERMGLK